MDCWKNSNQDVVCTIEGLQLVLRFSDIPFIQGLLEEQWQLILKPALCEQFLNWLNLLQLFVSSPEISTMRLEDQHHTEKQNYLGGLRTTQRSSSCRWGLLPGEWPGLLHDSGFESSCQKCKRMKRIDKLKRTNLLLRERGRDSPLMERTFGPNQRLGHDSTGHLFWGRRASSRKTR